MVAVDPNAILTAKKASIAMLAFMTALAFHDETNR